jgi:hypothetical protein
VKIHLTSRAEDGTDSSFSFDKSALLFLELRSLRNIRNTLSCIVTEILKLHLEAPLNVIDINTARPACHGHDVIEPVNSF